MLTSSPATSAEREGFEPSVQFNPYVSLANWWFQPLTHLSIYDCKELTTLFLGRANIKIISENLGDILKGDLLHPD
jgi:hypothetical protein